MSPTTASSGGGRIGVLLANLGTPEATDYWSMRRYLNEFLSDRRVIEENPIKWWFVLNFIILTVRPSRKGRDYDKIWNKARDESPLKTITRSQSDQLDEMMAKLDKRIRVDWAMRYGNPSVRSRLEALVAQDCERILLVPLYPQYAAATTATVCDAALRALAGMRAQPTLRVAAPYYAQPVYIDALAASFNAALAKLSFKPDLVVASYHGMPEDYLAKGDPYYKHCSETTALLRKKLKLDNERLVMTFQSRFGTAEWIKPYTIDTMQALPGRGVKNVVAIMPGFAADCLETLEEIAMENAAAFKAAGGENFAAVPCLNDSPLGMGVIRDIVLRELKGWI
jgi:protoporphyrin/coproporphyrin ferrochelatase